MTTLAYAMLDRITEMTAGAGMERYEVSAYAKRGPPLPAQPELLAVRRLPGDRRRRAQQAQFRAPRRAAGALSRAAALHGQRHRRAGAWRRTTRSAACDLPFEFMLNALRLREGFTLAQFSERTGLALTRHRAAAAGGRAQGTDRARSAARAADRARLRFPERPAGAVPGCSSADLNRGFNLLLEPARACVLCMEPRRSGICAWPAGALECGPGAQRATLARPAPKNTKGLSHECRNPSPAQPTRRRPGPGLLPAGRRPSARRSRRSRPSTSAGSTLKTWPSARPKTCWARCSRTCSWARCASRAGPSCASSARLPARTAGRRAIR